MAYNHDLIDENTVIVPSKRPVTQIKVTRETGIVTWFRVQVNRGGPEWIDIGDAHCAPAAGYPLYFENKYPEMLAASEGGFLVRFIGKFHDGKDYDMAFNEKSKYIDHWAFAYFCHLNDDQPNTYVEVTFGP